MHRLTMGAAFAVALLASAAADAQVAGGVYGADNSRIQRPRQQVKPPEPIARKTFDGAVARLFAAGDSNRDGTITLAEVKGVIDAHKTRIVAERFAAIDRDRDEAISMAEFAAWQRGLGSAVLDEEAGAGRPLSELVAEEVRVALNDDYEGRVLARVIVPLNSVALASANTDYDAGTSLAELLAFEGKEFDKLDRNKDGWLTADETRDVLRPELAGGPPPG